MVAHSNHWDIDAIVKRLKLKCVKACIDITNMTERKKKEFSFIQNIICNNIFCKTIGHLHKKSYHKASPNLIKMQILDKKVRVSLTVYVCHMLKMSLKYIFDEQCLKCVFFICSMQYSKIIIYIFFYKIQSLL